MQPPHGISVHGHGGTAQRSPQPVLVAVEPVVVLTFAVVMANSIGVGDRWQVHASVAISDPVPKGQDSMHAVAGREVQALDRSPGDSGT